MQHVGFGCYATAWITSSPFFWPFARSGAYMRTNNKKNASLLRQFCVLWARSLSLAFLAHWPVCNPTAPHRDWLGWTHARIHRSEAHDPQERHVIHTPSCPPSTTIATASPLNFNHPINSSTSVRWYKSQRTTPDCANSWPTVVTLLHRVSNKVTQWWNAWRCWLCWKAVIKTSSLSYRPVTLPRVTTPDCRSFGYVVTTRRRSKREVVRSAR